MLENIDIKFQLEILEKLLKIRRHIDQLLTLELTETSLSMREWELLMYVGQLQKTNISKLASLSRTQKTLVSKNIWQLIKLGLVQSQVNQKDRRQLSFSMTIEGQKQIRTIERQVSRNLKNPQLAAELMGLSKQVMELSRKLNRISLKIK
ncbi:MarR family transcriptional regulator [Lactiplantibacillus plantarum]